jgi:hypothetical protein
MKTNELDKKFRDLEYLKWLPWVGENYMNSNNKILVVGESHYQGTTDESIEKHKNPEFTRIVVNELAIQYLTKDKRSGTLFRNLNLALDGIASNSVELRKETWNQFAFYNFIQEPMVDISKRPSKVQIKEGWKVFLNVISILQPKKVLFIGSKVCDNYDLILNELGVDFEKIKIVKSISSRQKHRLLKLKIDGRDLEINFIKHTSSFFSWKKWNNHFNEIEFR